MKTTIIIIASAFFLASCHGHSYHSPKYLGNNINVIDDERIYNFLNTTRWFGFNDKKELNYLPIYDLFYFRPEYFRDTNTKSPVFRNEDIASMKKQFEVTEGKIWDSGKLSGIELIDFKLIDDDYQDGCTSLSPPIFSLDGNKCIIAVSCGCCGPLCGWDEILLFVKEHGEWLKKDGRILAVS